MAITKQDTINKLQTGEVLYVAYSQATKLPYVICDDESFNDQVWMFSTEEEIKKYVEKKKEEKIPLAGMRYENKAFKMLYGHLYSIGVNSIVWNQGDESIEIELSDVAKPVDLSKIEPKKRPLMNPTLQLSAAYFMQEVRRPMSLEERKEPETLQKLRELEEELVANICKSDFLVGSIVEDDDPKKIKIPRIKSKDGKMYQPIFTDIIEFEKFARGKQMRVSKIAFSKLNGFFAEDVDGITINPLGYNLLLPKEQARMLMGIKK